MKQILIFLNLLLLYQINAFSQNTNPYSIFGYHSEIEYKLPMDRLFRIDNIDTDSQVKAITIDFEGSILYFLGEKDLVLDTMNVNPDDILIWLSVDPLAEKYPSMSPYVYCANNPVMYYDPDGRKIWVVGENGKKYQYKNGTLVNSRGIEDPSAWGNYEKRVLSDLNTLASSKNSTISGRLNDLVKSKHDHTIENTLNLNGNTPTNMAGASNPEQGSGSKTYYDLNNRTEYGDGADYLPAAVLGHELLGHGWDNDKGVRSLDVTSNGIPMREVNAVNIQNLILEEHGLKTRTNYDLKNSDGTVKERKIPTNLLNTYFTKIPGLD